MNTKVLIDSSNSYATLECAKLANVDSFYVFVTCYDNTIGRIILSGGTFEGGVTEVTGDYNGIINVSGDTFKLIFTNPENISKIGNYYNSVLFINNTTDKVQVAEIINASELEKFCNLTTLNLRHFLTEKPFNLNSLQKLEDINFSRVNFLYGKRIHIPSLKNVYLPTSFQIMLDLQDCPNLTRLEQLCSLYPNQDISNFTCADSLTVLAFRIQDISGSQLHGNINAFSNYHKLTELILGKTFIGGDITSLPPQITKFNGGRSYDLSFGSVNGDKILDAISLWDTRYIPLTTEEIDNLIISLSKSTLTENTEIYLKGNRSFVSDNALTAITNITQHVEITTF